MYIPEVLSKFPFKNFDMCLCPHRPSESQKKDQLGWLSSITDLCPDPRNTAGFSEVHGYMENECY